MQRERADDGRLAGTKRPHQKKKLVHDCMVLKATKEWWMRNVRVWLFTESNTLSKIQHQSSPRLISYKNPVLIDWMGRGTFNVGNPKPCFYRVDKHSQTSWINRHLWSIGQEKLLTKREAQFKCTHNLTSSNATSLKLLAWLILSERHGGLRESVVALCTSSSFTLTPINQRTRGKNLHRQARTKLWCWKWC